MSTGPYRTITVPFTAEELQRVAAVAAAEGASVVDLIRARVFASFDEAGGVAAADLEDITTLFARLEGLRIRARGRGRV